MGNIAPRDGKRKKNVSDIDLTGTIDAAAQTREKGDKAEGSAVAAGQGYPDWDKSERYRTALAFARNGIPVFPCIVNGKKPAYDGGFKNADTSEMVIK